MVSHFNKDRLKQIIHNNKTLLANFSYVSMLQVFLLIAPLITYPYLVKVLGMELYGIVITAQVLASYASILIDFGSNSVCAKHVSINRNNKGKLSEIISSVLMIRFFLWLVCLSIYSLVVYLIPAYREYFVLFLLSYGYTVNEWLFPQFFFQGIEKMKYSTIANIVFKLVFIVLVFVVVKSPDHYLLVPILYTIGYFLGGAYALWIIFAKMGIDLIIPSWNIAKFYLKDSAPILATDVVCTIKDKFNYLLLGNFSGMSNVVVYDLGYKIYSLISRPALIVSVVFFPRSAKMRNIRHFDKVLIGIVAINIMIIGLVNIFLPFIVEIFLHKTIDLWPVRLFTLAPLFSTTSQFIISNMCIAYGYNKYVLYSILFTTGVYVVCLLFMFYTNQMNSLYTFVILAMVSYFAEFIYRLYAYRKVVQLEGIK